jgi:hypothetical protein
MDLDIFEKEFRKFKARVEPMLKEWEASKDSKAEAERPNPETNPEPEPVI